MRFSFVIPTLDEAAGIVAHLAALQAWRAQGHEVIVADGGSADATRALAEPLADRVLTAPRGRAAQMNAGAAAARGDALVFLHADTSLPDYARPAMRSALAHRLWGRFDVTIAGKPSLLRTVARLMNLRSRLTGIATGDQAIFVRRTAFAAVGGYPDQPLMEDIELSRRLKRLGPPVCLHERAVTSGRRWEANGPWRTVLLMWRLRFDYWRGVPVDRLAACYRIPAGRHTRIIVFAKAPVPGRTKTRLIPALGADGAARLGRRMLKRALDTALAAGVGPVELCMSPGPGSPLCDRIALPAGVLVSDQGGGDLGTRMARAARRALAAGERVLLTGTDCPELSARHLRAAATALNEHDAVLQPTHDGGYVLLGLRAFHPSLFEDIPWSTDAVAQLTLARLADLRWRVQLGETVHDIDTPADLVHLPPELTPYPAGSQA